MQEIIKKQGVITIKADLGLIGLAVMGENLVLNMENHGFTVAVHNRTPEKIDQLLQGRGAGKNIIGAYTIEELASQLKTPRKVMLMVKAGEPVDLFIERLLEVLEPGDIIIDGGNSLYSDTIRRTKLLEDRGLFYVGAGVSGGEEGALTGPSIMPGGSKEAWPHIQTIFQAIAAQVDGEPCCEWIGSDGSGHYVKMVHNGIEYADMQLIGEAYFLMKHLLGFNAEEMQEVFEEWNQGELDSYLIEITGHILGKVDQDTGQPLLELVGDGAGQKGTGKWTSQEALDLGVAAPTIAEGVFARIISGAYDQRELAAKAFPFKTPQVDLDPAEFVEAVRQALFASKICAYSQGFDLLAQASKEYDWNLNLGEIAKLWRGGCIIRAQFLQHITDAYDQNPDLENLLLAPYFQETLKGNQESWRKVVALAVEQGLPVPGFASALAYFDSIRHPYLWTNLVQAQRDYFGAHTYSRRDRPGAFHTQWQLGDKVVTSDEV
ncbi:MAG: NADP-dependent phosphogluconate dehydrogenase [Firmicutes bacterium]|nr:NADP-dependent phosphogluconate dehydrogenase [Bacillota bacterium]